jgi:ketosteroid isomerase-like protein
MPPSSAAQIAHAFVEAINRWSVDEIVNLMTDDHVFVDSLGMRISGKPRLKPAWAAYFAMIPDYSIAVDETLADGSVIVLLGTARGTYAANGVLPPENSWTTPAAWRAVVRDSRIAEWRVYADLEPLRQIMARSGK